MSSVYKFMEFISYEQAATWLKQLTYYSFSLNEFVQIYREDKCRMFMDVSGIQGEPEFNDDSSLRAMAVADGFREVLVFKPVDGGSFKNCKVIDIEFSGPYYSMSDLGGEKNQNWSARIEKDRFEPYFLSADIEALAAKFKARNLVEDKNNATKVDIKSPSSVDAMSGVLFPYSTKKLQALADAANKYWANYTPDKKRPTQKEVSMYLLEHLNRQPTPSGDIPRDIADLAGVIVPDAIVKS